MSSTQICNQYNISNASSLIEVWTNLGHFGRFMGPKFIFSLNQPIQIIFLCYNNGSHFNMGFFGHFCILKFYIAVDASLKLNLDTKNESFTQGL